MSSNNRTFPCSYLGHYYETFLGVWVPVEIILYLIETSENISEHTLVTMGTGTWTQ